MKAAGKSVLFLSAIYVFLSSNPVFAEPEKTPATSPKTAIDRSVHLPEKTQAKPPIKLERAGTTPSIQRAKILDPKTISIKPIKVKITSPTNGQTLKMGRTYNICWTHSSIATENYKASAQTVCGGEGPGLSSLSALQQCSSGGGSFYKIFENKPAKGCHPWTVPSNYFPYNYYIKVRLDSTQSDKWTRDEINVAIEK